MTRDDALAVYHLICTSVKRILSAALSVATSSTSCEPRSSHRIWAVRTIIFAGRKSKQPRAASSLIARRRLDERPAHPG